MPYRDKPVDELRVRRMARRQKRIDKRILARAEVRFQRQEMAHNIMALIGLMLLTAFTCVSVAAFVRGM